MSIRTQAMGKVKVLRRRVLCALCKEEVGVRRPCNTPEISLIF